MLRLNLAVAFVAVIPAFAAWILGLGFNGALTAAGIAVFVLLFCTSQSSVLRRIVAGGAVHPNVVFYFEFSMGIMALLGEYLTSGSGYDGQGGMAFVLTLGLLLVLACLGAAALRMRIDYTISWWRAVAVVVPIVGAFMRIDRYRRAYVQQTHSGMRFAQGIGRHD